MSNPTTVANKRTVRRLFEEGFNRRDYATIDELVDTEYADSSGARGPGAFRQVIDGLSHAFPDIRYTVEDLVAEDDRVAVRWYWSGTHRAPFRGLAPTERSLTNSGVAIFRLRAGKITAATLETDRLGFLQSIGVVPPNEALFGAGTAKPGAEPASP